MQYILLPSLLRRCLLWIIVRSYASAVVQLMANLSHVLLFRVSKSEYNPYNTHSYRAHGDAKAYVRGNYRKLSVQRLMPMMIFQMRHIRHAHTLQRASHLLRVVHAALLHLQTSRVKHRANTLGLKLQLAVQHAMLIHLHK
jgi:hypothetical protein